jgi:y4mF family transcriptional regulator
MKALSEFVKKKRKQAGLTQSEIAKRAGVGLRFVRELENEKKTLRLDKVDQILNLFGHTVGPTPFKRETE